MWLNNEKWADHLPENRTPMVTSCTQLCSACPPPKCHHPAKNSQNKNLIIPSQAFGHKLFTYPENVRKNNESTRGSAKCRKTGRAGSVSERIIGHFRLINNLIEPPVINNITHYYTAPAMGVPWEGTTDVEIRLPAPHMWNRAVGELAVGTKSTKWKIISFQHHPPTPRLSPRTRPRHGLLLYWCCWLPTTTAAGTALTGYWAATQIYNKFSN